MTDGTLTKISELLSSAPSWAIALFIAYAVASLIYGASLVIRSGWSGVFNNENILLAGIFWPVGLLIELRLKRKA